MIWEYFIYFAIAAILFWSLGAYCAWKRQQRGAYFLTAIGLTIFFAYILLMWHTLERPPMRTMGETRLWYSFFLPLAGIIVYARSRYHWILSFSTLLASVFIGINLLKPEIHTKAMMPALQSPWFAPHVIVYMFAYALFGAATLMALFLLWKMRGSDPTTHTPAIPMATPITLASIDNMVGMGWAFLTIGMLFGALWAKDAWGRLLGLGSQGDLGGHHLVSLFALYAPAPHVTR